MKETYFKYTSKLGRFSFNDSSPLKNTHIWIAENTDRHQMRVLWRNARGLKEDKAGQRSIGA
jgi:hypothetical protein